MIVCLVFFSFGLLVPGLWCNSVVVFASTHEANVPASMKNGMWLFTAEGRPKCPVTERNTRLSSSPDPARGRAARGTGSESGRIQADNQWQTICRRPSHWHRDCPSPRPTVTVALALT